MPGILRQNIYRGPGRLTLGGTVIDTKDGIALTQEGATADITSDLGGILGTIRTEFALNVAATPYGRVTQALLDALYPAWMRTPVIGSSVFGAADTPCVIQSRAGMKLTLHCAAVTTPPPLVLSTVKTAFGPMRATAILANGKLPGEAGALLDVAASPWGGDTGQERPQTGGRYTAELGDAITFGDTLGGFSVEFAATMEPVKSDNGGTIDYTFGGVRPAARFQPLDKSEADVIALLGLNNPRGSYTGTGLDLVIAGTAGLTLTLRNVDVAQGPLNWGVTALRAGELLVQASPDPVTGQVFDIGFTPPA